MLSLLATYLKNTFVLQGTKVAWLLVTPDVPFLLCKRRLECEEIPFGLDNACVSSLPNSSQDLEIKLSTPSRQPSENFAQDCEHSSLKHSCYIERLSNLSQQPDQKFRHRKVIDKSLNYRGSTEENPPTMFH